MKKNTLTLLTGLIVISSVIFAHEYEIEMRIKNNTGGPLSIAVYLYKVNLAYHISFT